MSEAALQIEGIKFSYLSSFADKPSLAAPVALPVSPEWPLLGYSAVAYGLDQIWNKESQSFNPAYIMCSFVGTEESGLLDTYSEIRAIAIPNHDIDPKVERGELPALKDLIVPAEEVVYAWRNNIKLSSNEEYFGQSYADRVYGYVPFELYLENLVKPEVGAYMTTWMWEYKDPETEEWKFLKITRHLIYVLVGQPGWPWIGEGERPVGTQSHAPPSIKFLRIACNIAKGAQDAPTAAAAITKALYDSPMLRYHANMYYSVLGSDNEVEIQTDEGDWETLTMETQLLKGDALTDRMRARYGAGPQANCKDFAHMLLALGNSIGCALKLLRVDSLEGDILLNTEYLVVNTSPGNAPYAATTFGYHELCGLGDDPEQAIVFDACIGFLEEDDAEEIIPVTNVAMPEYLQRMSSNSNNCSVSFPNRNLRVGL